MKKLLGTVLGVGLLISATSAIAAPEAFTFKSQFETEVSVGTEMPEGNTMSALAGNGTAEITGQGDQTILAQASCVAWSEPPESEFDIRYICDYKSGAGNWSQIAYCDIEPSESQGANCWGKLVGKTGRYNNKIGSITTFIINNGATGIGYWN